MTRSWKQSAFRICLLLFIVFSIGDVVLWGASWRCAGDAPQNRGHTQVIEDVMAWTDGGKGIAGLAVLSLWWMMLGRIEERA